MRPDEISAIAQIDLIMHMVEIVMENSVIEENEDLTDKMYRILKNLGEVQNTIYNT